MIVQLNAKKSCNKALKSCNKTLNMGKSCNKTPLKVVTKRYFQQKVVTTLANYLVLDGGSSGNKHKFMLNVTLFLSHVTTFFLKVSQEIECLFISTARARTVTMLQLFYIFHYKYKKCINKRVYNAFYIRGYRELIFFCNIVTKLENGKPNFRMDFENGKV